MHWKRIFTLGDRKGKLLEGHWRQCRYVLVCQLRRESDDETICGLLDASVAGTRVLVEDLKKGGSKIEAKRRRYIDRNNK